MFRWFVHAPLSNNLSSPGKSFYNRMTLKGKSELDGWSKRIQSGEAACLHHYKPTSVKILLIIR